MASALQGAHLAGRTEPDGSLRSDALRGPVSDETLRELLEKSARTPSGGNQPWRIYVVNGDTMTRFRSFIADRKPTESEYHVYPPGIQDPYRTNAFQLGEAMHEKLGIPREDKPARLAHMARNYVFFDAPAAFFCYVDRTMGPPQWSDLGMFLQTFMLLAIEAGLDTRPQEAWASHYQAVDEFVGAPENEVRPLASTGPTDTEIAWPESSSWRRSSAPEAGTTSPTPHAASSRAFAPRAARTW